MAESKKSARQHGRRLDGEADVGGEVELDYAPSGLVWRLTCPAASAVKPGEREQNLI
jgi:hypothetical protein